MNGAEQTCTGIPTFQPPPAGGAVPRGRIVALVAGALPERWPLLLAGGLMLAQSGAALSVPWLAGELTVTLVGEGEGNFASSAPIFLLLLAAFAAQALLSGAHTYLLARTGERLVAALRVRVFDHLQSLPLAFHHDRRRGELISLLTRDVDVLSGYVTGTLIAFVPMMLTFCGAWILMLRIDGYLAALAGLMLPVFFVVVRLAARRIRPLSKQVAEAHAAAVAVAEENIAMLPIVKALACESEISDRFRARSERVRTLGDRLHLILGAAQPLGGFLAASGVVALVWLGSAALAPAELVSFLLYGLLMVRPLGGLAATWGETQHARAAMERLDELLQFRPEPDDAGFRPLPPVAGSITFDHVIFGYEDRAPILQGLDLEVTAGETVAIIGANGAGKSTLVNLLMRFFDPRSGRVLVDGNDLASVSLASLRSQIGLVPQSILLCNASIAENIAFGDARPDGEAIRAAAEAACADGFVSALPEGYHTRVGERGVKLSGGQQQRIALARALYRDPPILVLDEATSMFDPEGEAALLDLGRETFRDRTVILITHRAASLAAADRVLRLEGGRIREAPGGDEADSTGDA